MKITSKTVFHEESDSRLKFETKIYKKYNIIIDLDHL